MVFDSFGAECPPLGEVFVDALVHVKYHVLWKPELIKEEILSFSELEAMHEQRCYLLICTRDVLVLQKLPALNDLGVEVSLFVVVAGNAVSRTALDHLVKVKVLQVEQEVIVLRIPIDGMIFNVRFFVFVCENEVTTEGQSIEDVIL